MQTTYGEFRMIAYESEVNGGESHIALVRGDLCPELPGMSMRGRRMILATRGRNAPPCSHPVLVRVHTRCTAGDVFAADCRCREMLDQSMRMIAEEGCGVDPVSAQYFARLRNRQAPCRRRSASRLHGVAASVSGRSADVFTRSCGPRRFSGPHGTDSAGDRAGRADSVGSRDPADSVAVEHADAHSGAGRIRTGDCGAGADSGGRVQPGLRGRSEQKKTKSQSCFPASI